MTANTNIHKAETITGTATRFDEQGQVNAVQATEMQAGGRNKDKARASPKASFGLPPGGTAST